MLIGGLVGTFIGVDVVRLLRKAGLFEVTVSLSYVTFLGVVGTLMMVEGLSTWRRAQQPGIALSARRSGQHTWVDRLPLKMRFHRSKLYISVLPPIIIGMFIGFMSAIMGIGGGFVMIPAMIYLLRVPTASSSARRCFKSCSWPRSPRSCMPSRTRQSTWCSPQSLWPVA